MTGGAGDTRAGAPRRAGRYAKPTAAVAAVLAAVLAVGLAEVWQVRPQLLSAAASGPVYRSGSDAASSTAPPSGPPAADPSPRRPATRTTQPRAAATDRWHWFGFDISWPQCTPHGPQLPPAVGSFAIVGITGGRPLTVNRCLSQEWAWALTRPRRAAYINLSAPPPGVAPAAFGAATVRDALSRAAAAGVRPTGIWLDVEVGNAWSADRGQNVAVVSAAFDAVHAAGLQAGIYSSSLDWRIITADAQVRAPEWKAVPDGRQLGAGCQQPGFGGRPADLVQAVFSVGTHNVDGSAQCTLTTDLVRLLGAN
ncbi:MAG: hypothetical protein NVS3B26_08650 [Mycobacteriales bacterium]